MAKRPKTLQDCVQRFLKLGRKSALTDWERGKVVNDVRKDKCYGDNAVEILADRTGCAVATLYRLEKLYTAWPNKADFEAVVRRIGPGGWSLSSSALQTIAAVAPKAFQGRVRERLIEMALVGRVDATGGHHRFASNELHRACRCKSEPGNARKIVAAVQKHRRFLGHLTDELRTNILNREDRNSIRVELEATEAVVNALSDMIANQ